MAEYANISQIRDAIENKWANKKQQIDKWKNSLETNKEHYGILMKNVETFTQVLGGADISIADAKITVLHKNYQEQTKADIQKAIDEFGGQDPEEREFYRFKHGFDTQKSSKNAVQMLVNAINFADKGHDHSQAIECLKLLTEGTGVNEKYVHQAHHLMQIIELDRQLEIVTSDIERLDASDYKRRQGEISQRLQELKEGLVQEALRYADEVEYAVPKNQIATNIQSRERYLADRIKRIEADIKNKEEADARDRERRAQEASRKRKQFTNNALNKTLLVRCAAVFAVIVYIFGVPFYGMNPNYGVISDYRKKVPIICFDREISVRNASVDGETPTCYAPFAKTVSLWYGNYESINLPMSKDEYLGLSYNTETTFKVPEGVRKLRVYDNEYLENISLSDSLEELEIEGSPLLKDIRIPEGTKKVWLISSGMDNCSIPTSVEELAIDNMPIKTLEVPDTVTSLRITSCDDLEELIIPASVKKLELFNCNSLKKLTLEGIPDDFQYDVWFDSLEEVNHPEGFTMNVNDKEY